MLSIIEKKHRLASVYGLDMGNTQYLSITLRPPINDYNIPRLFLAIDLPEPLKNTQKQQIECIEY